MRNLNPHGTYMSDWDPITMLKYIVSKHRHLACNIHLFSPDDLPKVERYFNYCTHTYKIL
jgi:hypothetical protein